VKSDREKIGLTIDNDGEFWSVLFLFLSVCIVDHELYGGSVSSSIIMLYSVPQRSVLGSRLFTADLTDVANEYHVTIHMFADDTQLYVHCGRDSTALTIVRLEQCIMDINHCMSANRLKLNMDKTELIWTGTRYAVMDWHEVCSYCGKCKFPVSESWR